MSTLDTHINDPVDNSRRRQLPHFNGSPEETARGISPKSEPAESIADTDGSEGTIRMSNLRNRLNDVLGMRIPPRHSPGSQSAVGARSIQVEPPESEAGSARPTSLYDQHVEHVPEFPPIHSPIPRRGQSMRSANLHILERPGAAPPPSDSSWAIRQPLTTSQHSLHPPPRVPSRRSPSYQKAVDPAGNFESDIQPGRFISERNRDNDGILGAVKELATWDIYNNEAKKVDIELVKDWRDSLNSLLVFAAIFAAVLTGFIIESKKLLEEDTAELLVEVAIFSINNMGNVSNLPFVRRSFEPDPTAISINCLLFASLGASLIAALASVVALQWVADYDAATTRGGSTPENRAKRRQFRFAGVVSWKMGEIIAALPLLLYSSVALFWAGAVLWIWNLHSNVGYVVVGGMAIAVLFYASTTLLAVIYVSAPFRTPLSRSIYSTFHAAMYVSAPFRTLLSRRIYWTFHRVMPPLLIISRWLARGASVLIPWFLKWFLRIILSPIAVTAFIVGGYHPRIWSASLLKNPFPPWTRTHFLPWTGRYSLSRQREDSAATVYPLVKHDALGWLANQLNISVDSYPHLLTLLREVLYLSPQTTLSQGFQDAPWQTILDSLGRRYIGKICSGTISDNDYEAVRILLRCSTVPGIASKISSSDQYVRDPSEDAYWTQHPFTRNQDMDAPDGAPESMIYLLTRDIPLPMSDSKTELLTTIEFIKWRNLTGVKNVDIWMHIFRHSNLYSPRYLQSCLQCFHDSFQFLHRQPSSWWLVAQNEEANCDQVIKVIEEIDNFMAITDMIPKYHGDLVALIGRDMDASGQRWPRSSLCPEDLRQRLFHIRDPCLAILGGYACGISVSVKDKLVPPYIEKYSGSLMNVRTLLDRGSLNTSTVDWEPSAASRLDPLSRTELFWRKTLENPYEDAHAMEHLPFIQLLLHLNFRDLIGCQDHSSGSHHVLFHMYMASSSASSLVRFEETIFVSHVYLTGDRFNPVLALLAFPDAEVSWTLDDDLTESSIKQTRGLCRDAQGKPDIIFPLLTDIATEEKRRRSCAPGVVALIEHSVNKLKSVDITVTESPEQLREALETLKAEMEATRTPRFFGRPRPGRRIGQRRSDELLDIVDSSEEWWQLRDADGTPNAVLSNYQPTTGSEQSANESEQPYSCRAKALYSYTASADDPNELSFQKGELFDIIDNSGTWWEVKNADGTLGIVPSNYLLIVGSSGEPTAGSEQPYNYTASAEDPNEPSFQKDELLDTVDNS